MPRYRKDGEPFAPRSDSGKGRLVTDHRQTAPFLLSCHHSVIFVSPYPRRNDEVFCKRCGEVSTVVMSAQDLTVRCRDCRYNARYGQALHRCRDAMARHRSKYPEHTVDSFKDGKMYETYEPMTRGELPLIEMSDVVRDDTIPF